MSSSCGSTNNAAFVKLCAVFEELSTGSDILEFEVLPKALQGTGDDILRDGRCIGVPKPLLVQAFLTARDVVLGHDIEADFRSNFRSIDVGECIAIFSSCAKFKSYLCIYTKRIRTWKRSLLS